jgi:CelD/BcsL family acetyltransferase involved in cellulose biosynthesis
VHTRILRGPCHWTSVGPLWTQLLDGSPPRSLTQRPEWARSLTEDFHGDDARWFLAEDSQGTVAAIPYQVSVRRLGPLSIRVLSNERHTDGLAAPRVRPRDLRRALLAASAAAGEPLDLLSLNGLRPGTLFLRLATAATSGLVTETQFGGYSVIDTTTGSDTWFAAAGRNLRGSLRKARNRFERTGAMTVTTATTPDEIEGAFKEFVQIEATGWKAGSGALANRPAEHDSLRSFMVAAAAHGDGVVRTLRLDGRPVAAQIACVTAGTLELLKVAYDDAVAELSPSNLLMADLIRECCDRPDVDRIDLVTNQPWHRRWHPVVHPTYRVHDVNPRRPGGLAGAAAATLEGMGLRLPRA